MMKAIAWPNGIGWDVGNAEVRDLVSKLRVFVPIASARDWSEQYGKWIVAERFKCADVPLGTDPVKAVAETRAHGKICEEPYAQEPVPMLFTIVTPALPEVRQ